MNIKIIIPFKWIAILILLSSCFYCKAQSPMLDTTKIILLVSDTSITQQNHGAYFQRGWIVRKFVQAGWDDYDRQIFPHWEDYKFLDNLKFEIPSYWLVWDYVEAK